MTTCDCESEGKISGRQANMALGLAKQTLPNVFLSILVAFCPKCPMCWASYLGAMGMVGISALPSFRTLAFASIILIGVQWVFWLKSVKHGGFGPLLLSTMGMLGVVLTRGYAPEARSALYAGIVLMLAGSLWRGFANRRNKSSVLAEQAVHGIQ